MSVIVTWGRTSRIYDKRRRGYNWSFNKWNRYSENVKRGYVLKCQSGLMKGKTWLEMTKGLLELEHIRNWGFEQLKKDSSCYDKLVEGVREHYGEEYHKWGMEGDGWTRRNNPFKQVVKK